MNDDLVIVARYHYRHQADFARQVLEDSGVPSALQIDDASGVEMGLTFVNPARLRVRAEDAERARDALRGAGLLEDEEEGDDGGSS